MFLEWRCPWSRNVPEEDSTTLQKINSAVKTLEHHFPTLGIHIAGTVGTFPCMELLQNDCKAVDIALLRSSSRTIWKA